MFHTQTPNPSENRSSPSKVLRSKACLEGGWGDGSGEEESGTEQEGSSRLSSTQGGDGGGGTFWQAARQRRRLAQVPALLQARLPGRGTGVPQRWPREGEE